MRIVPAVKGLVIHKNKVLIIKKRHYVSSPYDLPGGLAKPFENELNALLREIKEEISASVEPIRNLGPHNIINLPELHVSANIYLCRYRKGKIKLSKEHQSYQWVPINILKEEYPEWIRESLKSALRSLHYADRVKEKKKILLKRKIGRLRKKVKDKR